jgi:ABC-type dipeptide/oligopeptide/nickel transport system permease subunit
MSATEVAILSPRARQRRRMRRRLLRRPLAVAGLVVALAFVLIAILAPVLAPYDPGTSDFTAALKGPSSKHLLGTDELGRDILSRLIWSARVSMEAGVFSTLLALVIAVPIGLVAGYYRGWIDPVISRVTDVLLAFPFLILAVGLAAIFGPSLANATIALCVASVPLLIRVARGEALALREEDFVRAAVANGAGDRRILGRHILPNMASTLIVQATVLIPTAIIGEAVLSYLGVGVQPPTPSWGVMLVDGQNLISKEPRLVILPGVCIFLATLSFNLLGDGLRDMLDPRTRD